MIPLIGDTSYGQIHRQQVKPWLLGAGGGRNGDLVFNEDKILQLDGGDG